MTAPKVSIIIPFFNSRKFLNETVESVFDQSFQDWELLLVNDGCTDGSEEIAFNYAKQYPDKIQYLYHEGYHNRGASPSRNLGFKNSRGEFILFLDSDDVLLPESLKSNISKLSLHPEADAIFGETLYWYSWTGKPEDRLKDYIYHPWKAHGIEPDTVIQPPLLLNPLIKFNVMPVTCSLMLRREVLDRIGGWPEDIPNVYDDQGLFVKLFMRSAVFIASWCQEKYRLHDESWCSLTEKTGNVLPSRIFYLRWVKNYIAAQKFHDTQIDNFLIEQLDPYKNPLNPDEIEIPLPVGHKNFGDLHRLSPVSQIWGFDRGISVWEKGQPIDRYYIEAFLQHHSEDIKGRVLEIGDSGYTSKFGGNRVVQSDVLDVNPDNTQSTYIFDLECRDDNLPQRIFDCFILTQTLLLIFNIKSAINNAYTVLKPGGVLLVTLPGISKIERLWSDYWRFTEISARRLFGEVFGDENITVGTYGNVLAASAFLYGLASHELSKEELDFNDPNYQVVITVRAVKQTGKHIQPSNEVDVLRILVKEHEQELAEIKRSRAWKLAYIIRRVRVRLIPAGSLRDLFWRKFLGF
jgi:glycosyltransferase involved in cell wall biosynthesis